MDQFIIYCPQTEKIKRSSGLRCMPTMINETKIPKIIDKTEFGSQNGTRPVHKN